MWILLVFFPTKSYLLNRGTKPTSFNIMGYKRQMSQETKDKISKSLSGRKLSQNHIENIKKGIRKAWERVPVDPNHPEGKNIMLDVYTDNYGNKKIYHNGTELKTQD